jgi:2-hydroxycyclohexanecarboxyl-CoA dehydrogenase
MKEPGMTNSDQPVTTRPDVFDLTGRLVLVTGGGQGVGRETCLTTAAHGATVVVNDFNLERAESVAEEIVSAGGEAIAAACDVTSYEDVQRMVDKAGPIGVLINNAGNAGPVQDPLNPAPPFWETEPGDWDPWMGTNFYGVLNCARAVLPGMVERNWGRVLTVVSDAGRVGEPNLVVYSGAKAGAAGFSRGLAKAVGRYGITVNCVALSSVRTPAVARAFEDEDAAKRLLSRYVIRRIGEPSDAANMLLFLSSDAGEWITGQTYPVNGGYSFSF